MSDKKSIKRYDTLYDDVKTFFTDSTSGKLTAVSVTTLTRYAMELVQTGNKWKGMRGSEKKDLVLQVINALIEDLIQDPEVGGKLDAETKDAILGAVAFAPLLIDAAVDFAKIYNIKPRKLFLCCK